MDIILGVIAIVAFINLYMYKAERIISFPWQWDYHLQIDSLFRIRPCIWLDKS